ncbi:MAG: hypothetical protein R8M45_11980 [Ghiorsea sp.]
MNFDKLMAKASPFDEKKVKGKWFNIRYVVDMYAGEVMNIGVGFIDQHNNLHTKFLDSFHRLECLYDKRITKDDMLHVVNMIKACLPNKLDGVVIPTPSSSITYSVPFFASGDSVDAILASSYQDCVSLALPFPEKEKSQDRDKGTNTEQARKEVYTAIRHIAPMVAERIIAPNPLITIKSQDGTHDIDVPLQGVNFLGTVLSACQSSLTIKYNLSECSNDLRIVAQANKNDRASCFLLREEHLDKSKQASIDNVIDHYDWRFKALGIRLDVAYSPEKLAKNVIKWANI